MIRLYPPALSAYAVRYLAKKQRDVDGQATYAAQVARGKALWKTTGQTKSFGEVRERLGEMSAGRRCHYCEDSCADEIEHFRPKDLYPDWCYRWENYAYACGPCNGPKNNKFAVLDPTTDALVIVTRSASSAIVPPSSGRPALIDPRVEDPLEFMKLDLLETFLFVPIDDPSRSERKNRAEYTIKTLGLNDRDHLISARRDALEKLSALLFRYISVHQQNPSSRRLQRLADTVRRHDHKTVWEEMKRQRGDIGELAQLFAWAPEALDW